MRAATLAFIAALAALCTATATPTPAQEGAPDLSQALPIALGPGGSARGALEQPGASLLYRLDAIAGNTYVIETFAVRAGQGRGTSLTAYAAQGRFLASGITGSGDADRALAVVAPASAPLYLRVAGRDGWAGSFGLRALARFDQAGAAWGEDLEPNDWCELATPLIPGAEPQPHALLAAAPLDVTHLPDIDSYRLRMRPGQTYEVRVERLPPDAPEGAVSITLLDMITGQFLGPGAHSRSIGTSASLVYRAEQGGKVCARVAGGMPPSPWSGRYTFRLCEGRCPTATYLPLIRL